MHGQVTGKSPALVPRRGGYGVKARLEKPALLIRFQGALDNADESVIITLINETEWLKEKGTTEVFVCGLATDYCVKFTALDAAQFGFKTFFIKDASRGVNLRPDDVKSSIAQMQRAGVKIIRSRDILEQTNVRE